MEPMSSEDLEFWRRFFKAMKIALEHIAAEDEVKEARKKQRLGFG